jgi:Transposase/Transposase IS116/IS110/IS902 family
MKTNYPPKSIQWAALIGFDWGDCQHAVAIRANNQSVEKLQLTHAAETLHGWLDELEQRFGGRPVAIAIEASRGACVYAMMERPWIHLFPTHPATSHHQRRSFRPSGAKDDLPDAELLLSLLERNFDRLRLFQAHDPATRTLNELAQARRKAVDRRTLLSNQLTSALKDYFPQALEWSGEKRAAAMALDFLDKWPSLLDLKASKPDTIRRFYHAHNVRRPELIQERLQQIRSAKALTTEAAIVDTRVRVVRLLVAELRVLQEHISGFEEAIAKVFAAHPERALFGELPGAGANLAPRLVGLFGTDRDRWAQVSELQRLIGVAPVLEKSGSHYWVHWRWNAPKFLRQTLSEWAAQTVVYSPWARAYYEQQKTRGHGHWSILRSLAFKWLRILWRCWQSNSPYQERRYLDQLVKRRSPIATRALQLAQEMGHGNLKIS